MKRVLCILCMIAFLTVTSCKEKFIPPYIAPETGNLVVEGTVNNGPGNTTLILTRTSALDDSSRQYQRGATVTIQGEDNSSFSLIEKNPGNYSADNLLFNSNTKYRLQIKTPGGNEYLSDFTTVVPNPPIDSISWKMENEGLQVYVHANNPQDNTRYYQWEYSETWQFRSAFGASLKFGTITLSDGTTIISVGYKTQADYAIETLNCYRSASSTNLVLGTTSKLAHDLVYLPLIFIPPNSQKLTVLYSIDVKQYGWTKEGYEFLERIKKNTEGTGSTFDAQPSEVTGNIHSIANSNEKVIGFFNISTLQEKRFFISRTDLPDWPYNSGCFEIEIPNNEDEIKRQAIGYLPTNAVKIDNFGNILTFKISEPVCVDCRLTGTNIKPSYWPR